MEAISAAADAAENGDAADGNAADAADTAEDVEEDAAEKEKKTYGTCFFFLLCFVFFLRLFPNVCVFLLFFSLH